LDDGVEQEGAVQAEINKREGVVVPWRTATGGRQKPLLSRRCLNSSFGRIGGRGAGELINPSVPQPSQP
jgi:hypothetical protein